MGPPPVSFVAARSISYHGELSAIDLALGYTCDYLLANTTRYNIVAIHTDCVSALQSSVPNPAACSLLMSLSSLTEPHSWIWTYKWKLRGSLDMQTSSLTNSLIGLQRKQQTLHLDGPVKALRKPCKMSRTSLGTQPWNYGRDNGTFNLRVDIHSPYTVHIPSPLHKPTKSHSIQESRQYAKQTSQWSFTVSRALIQNEDCTSPNCMCGKDRGVKTLY